MHATGTQQQGEPRQRPVQSPTVGEPRHASGQYAPAQQRWAPDTWIFDARGRWGTERQFFGFAKLIAIKRMADMLNATCLTGQIMLSAALSSAQILLRFAALCCIPGRIPRIWVSMPALTTALTSTTLTEVRPRK